MVAPTLPELVADAAVRYADRTAMEERGAAWTFAELAAGIRSSAAAFVAAGIGHGDRVAVWAPNSATWVFAAAGAQSIGATLVPLNTRFKGVEASDILRRTDARVLVTVQGFLDTDYIGLLADEDLPSLEHILLLAGSDPRATAWDDFVAAGAAADDQEVAARIAAVGPDDLADIMFTSGTTGRPKGVMISHGQNAFGYERWTAAVGLQVGDRYLIVNPFFHAFGYKAGWMSCIMRGCTILPEPVFDVDRVLARVGAENVTVLPGPPTLYESILMHPDRGDHDLSSLRLAMTGAATIAPELIRRVRDEIGFETIVTGYGLTETAGLATQNRAGTDPETVALTSGPPLPDVEVRAVDDAGRELPAGEAGEIVVRGPNVMRGYLDDAEATAETIDADGWLHTGDVGFFDADGNIHITDRLKDMFIMGGFNCYPAEIEQLMFEMPEIGQVAVVGVPDERMGEVGHAYVVAVPGSDPTPETIIAWCREAMANYKVPRTVEIVDELPTTASGKVQRFALRERAAAARARDTRSTT
ncbi:MAG: FadD3 family acyl-CoA ligase [Acidimicrobiales bacterium]|nr:FadD3 family acyl-CoA ligase [Acidimicrobiales bacterium]